MGLKQFIQKLGSLFVPERLYEFDVRYIFEPQPNITSYELACVVELKFNSQFIIVGHLKSGGYDALSNDVKRHFKPMSEEEKKQWE